MGDGDDRMPRATMWWGIALLFGGGALIVLAPTIVNVLVTPNTESWAAVYELIVTIVSVLQATIPPLGTSLIAAALVMRHLDRRLGRGTRNERPKRWYFPPSAE